MRRDLPQEPRTTSRRASGSRELESRQLLGQDKRLKIRHGDTLYELRETRLGKLILTKWVD
ncbi:hemin uptake protein HemP [Haliea alexandrii]|uniref:hemin uptake protein HemP n=1 Tax=Haliea alexandrii TaxID=2448162 RepID=UPI0018EE8661